MRTSSKCGCRRIAIIGASGMVGQMMIKVIQERDIHADIFLFAGPTTAGQKVEIFGEKHTVEMLSLERVEKLKPDFALFAAGGEVSALWVPVFIKNGATVIDNSSYFRMDKSVPLVIPEINADSINGAKIIANPNCSTIGALVALSPLDKAYKIRRIVYSSYQAISGAGSKPKFAYPIENNILPHIDIFMSNGNTREEEKMLNETKKILGRSDIAVSATCVRVPVANCHSISINAEFYKQPDINEVKKILGSAPGVVLWDDPAELKYPIPAVADGKDEVYVGRIRLDADNKNTINMWTVSDNIRKGAATNAVQILELLL